ncbi:MULTISPECIES: hypothetical protein [Clostridium]|uniref:Uncharacterized protein n=2 Tax=Clostridium TaxID=1485 RepID=A0A3M0S0B9_9CLOT|nr:MULTISPECIES: hypothetical protein [Clostridium]OAA84268.1 hypothetical protein WX45_01125 [Clostridium ljungdahlii DSM 13528]QXE18057.1 hypothetical protein B5S50_03915 [Clostridium sp. 001]RMC91848.1 hypothetical protein D9O40_21610 [Clostridium autoethanogenum]
MKDKYFDELIEEGEKDIDKNSNITIDLNNKWNCELIKHLLKAAYEDGLEEGKGIRGQEIIDMLSRRYC